MGNETTETVTLPEGVSVGPPRETAQVNEQGVITQGMVFPIRLPGGGATSVFISYAQLQDTAYVQKVLDERVRAILAITG